MIANGETLTRAEAVDQRKQRMDAVDFKMVTFALSGKDYGIDIMNVKEIAKAGKFTFVPNADNYLRGVYNLRGDIIPVIDLRIFFHLPAEKKHEDALESMLILRIGDHVFGVIVDNIDKVVGISSTLIQAPHPIFGDINIKYIRGVVENQDRLYIILDIVRIFAPKQEEKSLPPVAAVTATFAEPLPVAPAPLKDNVAFSTSDLDFIKETLFANKRFATSELNEAWVIARFKEWKGIRKPSDVQLRDQADAEAYLEGFYSPWSGLFWDEAYAEAMMAILPDTASRNINVWNPGCGKGLETYSFACILRRRYPNARVKVWANDSDLLSISSAPNLVFDMEELPDYCREFTTKGKNGYSFSQDLKDSVMFEYHDVLNANPFPELDIVLARDLLSFLSPADQVRVFNDFTDKLKGRGILILGKNERPVPMDEWTSLGSPVISAWSRAD